MAAPASSEALATSIRSKCCGPHTHDDKKPHEKKVTVVITEPPTTATKIVYRHEPIPVEKEVPDDIGPIVVPIPKDDHDDKKKPEAAPAPHAPVPAPKPITLPEPEVYTYPEATPIPDDAVCFPADATVEVEGGSVKRMDALTIGDRVRVGSGPTAFSDVFMFTHKMADSVNIFVQLKLASGDVLRLTPSHYMYVNRVMTAAKNVAVGDEIELGTGARTTVASISSVSDVGLFNPQTLHGDIVVNNVRASTYTTAVEPTLAHKLLAPLRLLFTAGIAKDPSFGVLENGAVPVTSML